jgi:hypothetical protein
VRSILNGSSSLAAPFAAPLAFTLALAALAPACALKDRSSLASDTTGAEDVNGTESDVQSLGASLVSASGQSVAPSSISGIGDVKTLDDPTPSDAVGSGFQPAGCLTATVDTSAMTATYVFDACTGPLGLVELDGTVDVTWSQAPSGGPLTVDYTAHGFEINRATIDAWQATAVVTASGSARHVVWNATLSGTTARGRTFTRTNDKTIDWTVGQPCVTVSGESDGTILGTELQTSIVSYSQCAAECPQAGSEITVKDVKNGDSIDIKYDGGPEALLTVDGHSSAIGLACGL